jgi:3-phosphoshikimate 1-carboxyvinyltransferase
MVGALKALGVQLQEDWENDRLVVEGCGGRFPVEGCDLFLGNAGTAMRPLTAAVAAAGRGRFVLDGVARMRERPIQDLVDGLVQVRRHCIHPTLLLAVLMLELGRVL